jgi:ABC-type transport system substrate-binding protein/DNA-binding SARP family transcriptional activator
MTNTLQLKVFVTGRVAIETDSAVIDEAHLGGRQARLLFVYLVAERSRAVPRDELAEALWGETPPVTRDKALTVIASKLRGALADAGLDRREILTAAFGCYRLDLPEGTWVDLFAAASGAEDAEEALAAGDLDQARAAAKSAESLARRPFLPGEDGTWVEQKRRDLADIRERALSVLADACLRSGASREAAKWAEELIALSPFREAGYRRLMEAHVAAGNRAEALRVFDQCRQLLAEELGAYPSPETESIYRELLALPAPGNGAVTDDAERPNDVDRTESTTRVVAEAVPSASVPPREVKHERPRAVRRRLVLGAALAGVIAVAVAVPLVALSTGGSRAPELTLGGNDVGAVSASTGHIFASTPLAGSPDAITAGDGSIWAAMPDRGIVSRIETTTNTVQQTIRTPGPGGPSALTFGGGFIWVADTLAGTVSRIDPQANGGQLVGNPIHVGNDPTGIAYGLGAVWVANSVDRTVTRINPLTGTPGPPISVEQGADDVAVGDGSVWVIARSTGVVSRIDPTAPTVVGTTAVDDPAAVAIGPDAVWVANGANGTVSKINPSNGDLEAAFPLGGQPSGIAVAGDGHVWVTNAGSASLTELDPATGRKIRTVHTGAVPGGIVLDGDTAYVAAQVPPSAHRGGTLTLAIANAPGTYALPIPQELDPAGPCSTPPEPVKTSCPLSGLSAAELLTLTNDGLLGYSQAGGADSYKVVADLAAGVPTPSNGGLTYTFRLRKGIRYSTGEVVQPADIRRGIERALLDSKGQGPGAYLAVIEGAGGCLTGEHCDLTRGITTSPGSSTVTFHLSKPDPDFLYQLALPDYDAVPASTPLHARLPLPATGPYKIAGWRPKGVVVLVRNPRFRVWSTEAQPDGYPDKIVERYRYTGAQAIHAVERGTADITADGLDQRWPPELAASLKTRYSTQLYPEPILTILGLWLNTRVAPFNDVRVRQALNLAVNRQWLAQINSGRVACQFLPPGLDGYSAYCPYNGPDLVKARKLVAESGTKGQPVTIWSFEFPTGTPQIGLRNGRYFVSVLQSLGYDARLKLVSHQGVSYTWLPGRQAGIGGWGANIPSPDDILSGFLCSSYTNNPATNGDVAGLCDRRLDAQIARARALDTTNPTAAAGVWHSIDRMLTDDAPWVAMKLFVSSDFVSRRVGNYKYCWLSGTSGLTGACLDQVWVR